MSKLIEERPLFNKLHVFEDRWEAGKLLAEKLMKYKGSDSIVLAIPSGGVPVAAQIASILDLPADLVIVRKIQIPYSTEAGFGAMGPEGEFILNEPLVYHLGLREDEIVTQRRKTMDVIGRREQVFREGRPYPDMMARNIIIVDDGLASGYTMLAAIAFTRRRGASNVVIAVPTASNKTVDFLLPQVDELVCLNVRTGYYFAVADAYRHWYDLGDEEVLSIIKSKPFVL